MAATQQAWDDWQSLKNAISEMDGMIRTALVNAFEKLEGLKTNIIDDANRKNAMNPLANQHPIFTVNYIESEITRLFGLWSYLSANGYL